MSQGQIKAIKYEVEEVGKHIKGTKRRYLWVLSIGQRIYNFVLDDSVLSGRSKLTINGRVFHQIEQGLGGCNYSHTFIVDECLFNISYQEGSYQMKINRRSFCHLLALQRKDQEFKAHRVDENSFSLTQNSKPISQKKITLSLPGMSNGMKKKKPCVVQSDNWSSFCQAGAFDPFAQKIATQQVKQLQVKQQQNQRPLILESLKQSSNITPKDFNTLQDLFKTMTTSKPFEENVSQGQTPTYQIQQIPALPQINLKEFSTIQQLFATSCNQNLQVQKCSPPNIQKQFYKKQQVQNNDFKTMQPLFSTITSKPQNILNISKNNSAQNTNFCDFNTIQQLFATNIRVQNQSQSLCKQSENVKPSLVENTSSLSKESKFDEFTTIQCIYGTNNGQKQPAAIAEQFILSSTSKANESKYQVKGKEMAVDRKLMQQQVKQKDNVSQKSKWDDFNTMQNLFKTGVETRKENQFWKF